MHMVDQCDGITAVKTASPAGMPSLRHLFDELGGWRQVTCCMVSPQHFRKCMHQDPVKVRLCAHDFGVETLEWRRVLVVSMIEVAQC